MYADKIPAGKKRSVMDRLGASSGGGGSFLRPDAAKRLHQADGTWRRELYKDSGGTQNSPRLTTKSLKANQRTNLQKSTEVVKKSSVPDLRDKLSGVKHPQLNSTVQIPKPVRESAKGAKPVQTSAPPSTATLPITKKVNAPSALKQSQEKVESSLDSLLKSLGLQKYSITFQAEEVDMKALVHMTEEDLKSLGIPMGPRKKILSALASEIKKPSGSLPTS